MIILSKLISLANSLDKRGFIAEATALDNIIIRLAMSKEEARRLLGVSFIATEDEIQRAWKLKALEHHPDKGGDIEMMKQINVARDVLAPKPEQPVEPPVYKHPPRHRTDTNKGEEETGTPFDTAVSKAGIPPDTRWKFVTEKLYGTYGFDTNVSGFVAYGSTENEHIFVGVYNRRVLNAYSNINLNDYSVFIDTAAISEPLSSVAPRAIRNLWNNFDHVKQYNAKVILLDDGAQLTPSMGGKGRGVAFKDAMDIMGEKTPETWTKNKKIDIVMELGYPPKGVGGINDFSVIFVVNGKPYILSEDSSKTISKMRKLLTFIFGAYYYADSKKNLTRQPAEKRKLILEHLAKNLEGREPSELIEAFRLAWAQAQ